MFPFFVQDSICILSFLKLSWTSSEEVDPPCHESCNDRCGTLKTASHIPDQFLCLCILFQTVSSWRTGTWIYQLLSPGPAELGMEHMLHKHLLKEASALSSCRALSSAPGMEKGTTRWSPWCLQHGSEQWREPNVNGHGTWGPPFTFPTLWTLCQTPCPLSASNAHSSFWNDTYHPTLGNLEMAFV
jgi:hypothetical protein